MNRVVHLSDLHLGAAPDQAETVIAPLVRVLRELRETWDSPPSLLAITGDLHDSADVDVADGTRAFLDVLGKIRDALGGDTPTAIVPGNHDRRTQGLTLPFRTELVSALGQARLPGVVVAGQELPFLAKLLDDGLHGLPFAVAVIDSSYTPTGFISAGGLLRATDLLELAAQLAARDDPQRPLLLLTHHHLVPTPVTDTSRIDADTANPVLRWMADRVLAGVVSYANHEEWMMTALGAGTALSTLQAFGRPVLVLHGHKHYPTVRTLRATLVDHGDVVLLSAGSAGLALPLDDGDDEDVARLWPSFHVLELEDSTVRVRTVAFYGDARPATRDLLEVTADGAGWRVSQVDDRIAHHGPRFQYNRAEFTLRECSPRPKDRWDVEVVRVARGEGTDVYREHLRGATGARFVGKSPASSGPETRSLEIKTDGSAIRYALFAGAVRSTAEAMRIYGAFDPFEGVELQNRYESREARLTLRGLPDTTTPFGSAVDLTRGQAMPHPIRKLSEGAYELTFAPCPPRTQLRIQWRPE